MKKHADVIDWDLSYVIDWVEFKLRDEFAHKYYQETVEYGKPIEI